MPRWKVKQGDCLDVLKGCPSDFFDAMVTDPPAGVSFMGREWDSDKGGRDEWISWLEDVMREAMRTLKPGAHCLVWALPRTSHWTATALENAGFEVRDCVTALFGSGFPKSADISKHIDRMAGAEREVVGTGHSGKNAGMQDLGPSGIKGGDFPLTAPATEEAKAWSGWGTALKPAAEFWWLARKPLAEKSIARNVLAHGTGGLNIGACRVGDEVVQTHGARSEGQTVYGGGKGLNQEGFVGEAHMGRWPANLVLSHAPDCGIECVEACPVAELDRQSGKSKSGKMRAGTPRSNRAGYAGDMPAATGEETYGDSGGASRFFPTFRYQAKPSRSEKEAGLQDLPDSTLNRVNPGGIENDPRWAPVQVRNNHPTVKAIALCRWLCRLITPPGGAVLDPFAGSGSIGCAALQEGFDFFGIEQDPHYVDIITARLKHWENQP